MKMILPLLLLSAGCHISSWHDSNIVVDGVELEAKHEEVLQVDAWSAEGLRIESAMGDVRVERIAGGGPSTVQVELHELFEGDAYAVLEGGRLSSRSRSGEPTAVGDVLVRTNDLPGLTASTGMGDLTLVDVLVAGGIELETGMGDVLVQNAGSPQRVDARTGMGDVEIQETSVVELTASSGMGDVELERVLAEEGVCSSGMGDVDLEECSFVRLTASTGMGDIDCTRTSYEEGDLDTGLGRVSKRD